LGAVNPENTQAKRIGELYGNRVPGLNAPAKPLPSSRPTSPSPPEGSIAAKGRSFTLSGLDTDRSPSPSPFRRASQDVFSDTDDDFLHSSPSISPTSPTDRSPSYSPSPRRNSFATALESARRRESISSELELLYSRTQLPSGMPVTDDKKEDIADPEETVEHRTTPAPTIIVSSIKVLAEEPTDTSQAPELVEIISPVSMSPDSITSQSSDIALNIHTSSPPDSDQEASMTESDSETPRPSMDTSSFRPLANDSTSTTHAAVVEPVASLEGSPLYDEQTAASQIIYTTPTLRSNVEIDIDGPIWADDGSAPSSATTSEDTAVDSAVEDIKGADNTIGNEDTHLPEIEKKASLPLATVREAKPSLSLSRIPTSSSEPCLTTMKPAHIVPATRRPSRSSQKTRIPVVVPPTSYIREDDSMMSEYGSVTVLTQAHSASRTETPYSEPKLDPNSNAAGQQVLAFKAVVHKKVTETPSASSTPIPMSTSMTQMSQVAQMARVRRLTKGNALDAPESSAYQELAVLLEEAARLEQSLSNGHIPSEDNELTSEDESSASESTSGQQQDDSADVPPTPPPKPHKTPKYLAGLRKLKRGSAAFRNLPSFPRLSTSSEMSSEDSMAVATPPDSFDSSGETQSPVYDGNISHGIGWPSLSPRKSPSLRRASSRASSFADKIFSRNRTRSTASSVYTQGVLFVVPILAIP
jgi:hypothetical protein